MEREEKKKNLRPGRERPPWLGCCNSDTFPCIHDHDHKIYISKEHSEVLSWVASV